MKTLKQLAAQFEKQYQQVKEHNKNVPYKEMKKTPDWKPIILGPVIKEIEKKIKAKLKNKELCQFGLRSHVPLTFVKDNKDFVYLDISNSLESGALFISDFSVPPSDQYKTNTIGQINGFNTKQIKFDPEQTPEDIADYISFNIDKFIIGDDERLDP